jgi:hypothetical protein
MTETATPAFKGWAVLELMGHRRRAGMVEEVEIAGGKLLRIDIPVLGKVHQDNVNDGPPVSGVEPGGFVTEFYGCSAVYALRPVSEDIARRAASEIGDPRPVRPVEYREREAETERRAIASRGWDDEPEPVF